MHGGVHFIQHGHQAGLVDLRLSRAEFQQWPFASRGPWSERGSPSATPSVNSPLDTHRQLKDQHDPSWGGWLTNQDRMIGGGQVVMKVSLTRVLQWVLSGSQLWLPSQFSGVAPYDQQLLEDIELPVCVQPGKYTVLNVPIQNSQTA